MRAVAFQSPSSLKPLMRLLTTKGVARLLSIREKTVYSYVSKGLMPSCKIQSSVRFRANELSLWLSRHGYAPR